MSNATGRLRQNQIAEFQPTRGRKRRLLVTLLILGAVLIAGISSSGTARAGNNPQEKSFYACASDGVCSTVHCPPWYWGSPYGALADCVQSEGSIYGWLNRQGEFNLNNGKFYPIGGWQSSGTLQGYRAGGCTASGCQFVGWILSTQGGWSFYGDGYENSIYGPLIRPAIWFDSVGRYWATGGWQVAHSW